MGVTCEPDIGLLQFRNNIQETKIIDNSVKNHLNYSFAIFRTTRGNYTQFRITFVNIRCSFALNFFELYFNKGLKD